MPVTEAFGVTDFNFIVMHANFLFVRHGSEGEAPGLSINCLKSYKIGMHNSHVSFLTKISGVEGP